MSGDHVAAESIVELGQVSKRFGSTQAHADVSLTIGQGEVHALVGENGADKSRLGRIISGVITPDQDLLRIAVVAGTGWTTRQTLAARAATTEMLVQAMPGRTASRRRITVSACKRARRIPCRLTGCR